MINYTIEDYRTRKLALIQKVPTPITPVNIEPETRHITLAYFDKQSTVDYIGAVQGIPVCFDAKECKTDTFPLANVHEHQLKFMEDMEKQDGISFLLIYYTERASFSAWKRAAGKASPLRKSTGPTASACARISMCISWMRCSWTFFPGRKTETETDPYISYILLR